MMKLLAFVVFALTTFKSSAQSILQVEDIKRSIGKDISFFESTLLPKEFTDSKGLTDIAEDMAKKINLELGSKYKGKGYSHADNYASMIVYDSNDKTVLLQFGTKKPKKDEMKRITTCLTNLGYKKTSDKKSDNGEFNLRSYHKDNIDFSLASYFNGGYTLTGYFLPYLVEK